MLPGLSSSYVPVSVQWNATVGRRRPTRGQSIFYEAQLAGASESPHLLAFSGRSTALTVAPAAVRRTLQVRLERFLAIPYTVLERTRGS